MFTSMSIFFKPSRQRERFGDVLDEEVDWSDADFVFIHGFAFPDHTLSAIFEKAKALKFGSKVCTLSLPSDEERLYGTCRLSAA